MSRTNMQLAIIVCLSLFACQYAWTVSSNADSPMTSGRRSVEDPAAAKIQRLIKQLDNPKFSERQAATKELRQCGESALPALREAARGERGLEVRRRVEQLVNDI